MGYDHFLSNSQNNLRTKYEKKRNQNGLLDAYTIAETARQ